MDKLKQEIMARLGRQIRDERMRQGMSQLELAKRVGYAHYQPILRWEKGITFPSPEGFFQLKKVLGLDLNLTPENNNEIVRKTDQNQGKKTADNY